MEFSKGIWHVLTKQVEDSIILAIVFFFGHVLIAMAVVSIVTGASFWEAGVVALIEPAINSIWFLLLHKIWKNYSERKTKHSK
tara:strand:- start:25374 stop:25622 length:249 start_codon:yes stop_codon:yes gene_type:complete